MQNLYTKAVLDLIEKDEDIENILSGLKRTLAEHGHSALMPKILQAVLSKLTVGKQNQTKMIVKSVADSTKYIDAISTIMADTFATANVPVLVEDPSIIGGFIVEHDYKRVDMSYKSKLLQLYRGIIS